MRPKRDNEIVYLVYMKGRPYWERPSLAKNV